MPHVFRRQWKHRVRVYKLGSRWTWKCTKPSCKLGVSSRSWTQQDAFRRGFQHASHGGYWPDSASITGYSLDMRDDEEEDDYVDRLLVICCGSVE